MIDTLDEVAEALAKIKEFSSDPERAFGAEVDLYIGVLEGIAAGAWGDAEPRELASLALKAQDIDFPRWCA